MKRYWEEMDTWVVKTPRAGNTPCQTPNRLCQSPWIRSERKPLDEPINDIPTPSEENYEPAISIADSDDEIQSGYEDVLSGEDTENDPGNGTSTKKASSYRYGGMKARLGPETPLPTAVRRPLVSILPL